MPDNAVRVLIDGRLIGKPRGLGRYVRELVHSLATVAAADLEIAVVLPRGMEATVSASAGRIRLIPIPAVPIPVWEQLVVPLVAASMRADLVHCPCNTKSLLFNRLRIPHVVTIHDLIFFQTAGANWYQKIGNRYRRFVVRRMLKGPMSLISVSDASRQEILSKLGRDAAVIPMPVELFASSARREPPPPPGAARRESPYFVHIGGEGGYKNTALVVEAFLSAGLSGHRLVVLGVSAQSRTARKYSFASVEFPGILSDPEVAARIAGAVAMLFPSLCEGYGLPIIEAFALGCPVVTSDLAPMSEVAGSAALLVNPRSKSDVTRACIELASSPELCKSLAEAGQKRVAEFSAKSTGARLADIYREVAGHHHDMSNAEILRRN